MPQEASELLFTLPDVIKFCAVAITVGGILAKIDTLKTRVADYKESLDKLVEKLEQTFSRQLSDSQTYMMVHIDALHTRSREIEERNVSALEKLGEGMSDLAREVREGLGDHSTRIRVLENNTE